MRSLSFAFVMLVACRYSPEKCEKACRNYRQLVFWEQADAEIAKQPPAARDALRKQKLAELEASIAKGIDWCTSKCTSANFSNQVDCLIEAKTAQQAKECSND